MATPSVSTATTSTLRADRADSTSSRRACSCRPALMKARTSSGSPLFGQISLYSRIHSSDDLLELLVAEL